MSPVTPLLPQHQQQHQHHYLPLPTTPLHSPALSTIDMPSPYSPASSSSSLPPERSVSPKRQTPSARSCRLHRPLHPFQFLGLIILIILSLTFIHPHPRASAANYFSSSGSYLSDYLSDSPSSPSHPVSHIPPPTGGVPSHLRIPLTLEARLSYLLSRPALWQYEAELPSRHKCPFYTYNRNVYFFHEGKQEQWERITPSDIRRYRSKIVDYLRGVERDGGKLVWDKSMEDGVPKEMRRGIIYAAGEGKDLERLKLSLHMLRNVLHSTLPVELYHFTEEFTDASLREELSNEYGITFRAVDGRRPNGKSWNIKNIAFLASNFTEFVYMDSDNLPLSDPALLFDSIEYQQSGSVFWPDLNKDHPDNAIFRILGRDCSDEHWPAEAGQIVFDKRGNNGLNLAVLHLSNHMMANEEMYGFLSYGDKDTFRFSFYALGLPYQQAPKMFASAGGYQTEGGESSLEFCGHSLVQWGLTPKSALHDPTYHPPPAFLHMILTKHRRAPLQPEKLFSHLLRPRLNGINDDRLVRTYYEWTGACFAITLKGPDGARGVDNSVGDGQGLVMQEMKDVLGGGNQWEELMEVARRFVQINQMEG